MLPATKPAVKFAPRILVALASSPTRERILLLIYTNASKKASSSQTSTEEKDV